MFGKNIKIQKSEVKKSLKVVGIREVNYKSQKTGEQVHGYEFHGTFPSNRCIAGELTDKQYISAKAIEENGSQFPNIGDEIEFTYNRYGKVASFKIVR